MALLYNDAVAASHAREATDVVTDKRKGSRCVGG